MELSWGNILHFNSEKDYYEVLGFLSKEEELIRVYTENNDKAGAWSGQEHRFFARGVKECV